MDHDDEVDEVTITEMGGKESAVESVGSPTHGSRTASENEAEDIQSNREDERERRVSFEDRQDSSSTEPSEGPTSRQVERNIRDDDDPKRCPLLNMKKKSD